MVITISIPVKTLLKIFWTLWESSLSRLRPSRGTETLFTLCSTHQSLMCFLFVIKLKKKKKKFCRLLPVSLYIHQVFCFVVSLFPPHICLWMSLQYLHHMHNLHLHNVLRVPVVGLKKYHLFCGLPLVSCMGLDITFVLTLTLPLLDLSPQVHCSLCQRPARGITCSTRRQMIPGVAFSC